MIVIRILGGLASQLQQFSNGQSIANYFGTELALDLTDYYNGYFRPYLLDYLELADTKKIVKIEELRRYVNVKNGDELLALVKDDKLPDCYLSGEAEEYRSFYNKYPSVYTTADSAFFSNIEMKEKSDFIERFTNQIANSYSVGVHIRLGDFEEIGWVDSVEKYQGAIGLIIQKHPDAKLFFFSNDIKKTAELFGRRDNFYYVNNKNGYIGDIEDLFCFAMCDAKILSTRSGYSRYAAYIGKQKYGKNNNICLDDNVNHRDAGTLLSEDEIRKGREYYNLLGIKNNNKILKYNLVESAYPIEARFDTMMCNSSMFNKEEKLAFWEQYYNKKRLIGKKIVISSFENYTGSYINSKYEDACKYSRLGADVLYIAKRSNRNIKKDAIIRASDLDGNDQGFDIYLCDKSTKKTKDIVNEWLRTNEYTEKPRVIRDSIINIVKKIYSKIVIKMVEK